MEHVSIKTFTNHEELTKERGVLEKQGIRTFVNIEMSQVYKNDIDEVKLLVATEDLQRAMKVMHKNGYITTPAKYKPTFEDKVSHSLNKNTGLIVVIILLVFLMLIAFIYFIFSRNFMGIN